MTAAKKLKLKRLHGHAPMKTVTSVDLFCGAGGTSTGLAEACKELGAPVELMGTREQQVKQIGNAVCCNMAKAICKALLEE